MWLTGHSPLTYEHACVAAFFRRPLLIISVLLVTFSFSHSSSSVSVKNKNTLYLDTSLFVFLHTKHVCVSQRIKNNNNHTWCHLNVPFWLLLLLILPSSQCPCLALWFVVWVLCLWGFRESEAGHVKHSHFSFTLDVQECLNQASNRICQNDKAKYGYIILFFHQKKKKNPYFKSIFECPDQSTKTQLSYGWIKNHRTEDKGIHKRYPDKIICKNNKLNNSGSVKNCGK